MHQQSCSSIELLPVLCLESICRRLDLKSLQAFASTSKAVLQKITSMNSLWQAHCNHCWSDKVYVCPLAKQHYSNCRCYTAFIIALQDSKRCRITYEELTSFDWWMRFTDDAGEEIRAVDPWHRGEAKKLLMQKFNGKEKDWTKITVDNGALPSHMVLNDPKKRKWYFCDKHGNGKKDGSESVEGSSGDYILTHWGRGPIPIYRVCRHSNWGFYLLNIWSIHTTWPIPGKGVISKDDPLQSSTPDLPLELSNEQAEMFNQKRDST